MVTTQEKKLSKVIIESINMIKLPRYEDIKYYVKTDPTVECIFSIDIEHTILGLTSRGIIDVNNGLYTVNHNKWVLYKEEIGI